MSALWIRRATAWTAVLVLGLSAATVVAEEQTIEGVGKVGPAQKLHTDFKFTEGPAADADGNIYFTDIPEKKIYKYSPAKQELTLFTDDSNHSNGLMFNGVGELVAAEMDGQIVAWDLEKKERRSVAAQHNDARFNAPNDLVVDQAGGVYFTDPAFRAPDPLPQGTLGVYYVDADGKVSRIVESLPNPNGVILSPDEKTLYVVPTGQAEMLAYPIEAPGKLGEPRVFCTLKQPEGKEGTGGDGLTIDTKGNLYITSILGVQVFDADGKLLGIIELPEQPANLTFGGKDNNTLYITARTSLYAVPTEATGHQFPGKKSE